MPAHARKKSQPYPRPHRAFVSNLQAPGPDHTPLSSDFGRRAFIRLMKCKVQTRVWYSWRMFHARTKRQRQTLRRHTEMQRTASLFRHFVAWKCLSNQLLETSCVIRRTITRWKQLLLGRGMNRWREMTERARRQRGLGQRAVLRWVRRHQARALAAWVQLVSDGRRRRRVVLHAARRWGQRSVAMAVDRWREMTERARRQSDMEALSSEMIRLREENSELIVKSRNRLLIHDDADRELRDEIQRLQNTLVQRDLFVSKLVAHIKQLPSSETGD